MSKSTVKTTTIGTPGTRRAAALDAYRAMWSDVSVAAKTSDASSPALDDHATDRALKLLRFMMREDRKNKVVTKGKLYLDPTVEKDDAAAVVIHDCADASDWLHYNVNGMVQLDGPGGHHRVDASVRRHRGVWRVEHLHIGQVGTC